MESGRAMFTYVEKVYSCIIYEGKKDNAMLECIT